LELCKPLLFDLLVGLKLKGLDRQGYMAIMAAENDCLLSDNV
jgi:hypothetical protein